MQSRTEVQLAIEMARDLEERLIVANHFALRSPEFTDQIERAHLMLEGLAAAMGRVIAERSLEPA